ncbi:hypothetical protein Trydic_g7732 [Trypoxylus dichotomus]
MPTLAFTTFVVRIPLRRISVFNAVHLAFSLRTTVVPGTGWGPVPPVGTSFAPGRFLSPVSQPEFRETLRFRCCLLNGGRKPSESAAAPSEVFPIVVQELHRTNTSRLLHLGLLKAIGWPQWCRFCGLNVVLATRGGGVKRILRIFEQRTSQHQIYHGEGTKKSTAFPRRARYEKTKRKNRFHGLS